MRVLTLLTALLAFGVGDVGGLVLSQERKEGQPTPKLPLGKETTYVTGPLDKNGYIDYQAALNDRLGEGSTPEKNANVLLWKALGPAPEGGIGMPSEFFRRMGMDKPPPGGAYLIGFGTFIKDHLKLAPGKFQWISDQQSQAAQRPWTALEYPHIAIWLNSNERPLALVVEATRRPHYFSPLVSGATGKGSAGLVGALLPGVQKCREVAQSLICRAMLRTATGKNDEAWQDLLACHRLGRLIARGPTLMEWLVGVAIEQMASNADLAYLERANLNAQQIRDCLKDLQDLPPLPPLADKVDLTERLTYLDTLQRIRRDGLGALDRLGNGKVLPSDPEAAQAMNTLDWEPALRSANAWYDRIAATLRLRGRGDRKNGLDKIEKDIKTLKQDTVRMGTLAQIQFQNGTLPKTAAQSIGDLLITLILPATRKVNDAGDRIEQVQRNLHIAFALAAYRRDKAAYPAALEELVPAYLTALPDDLFSGKPIVWRPTVQGYLLYSVGVNGKDEAGRSYDNSPAGDDLNVRMPRSAPKTVYYPAPAPATPPTGPVAEGNLPPMMQPPAPAAVPSSQVAAIGWLIPALVVALAITMLVVVALALAIFVSYRCESVETSPPRADKDRPGSPGATDAISFLCTGCGKSLKVKPALAGIKVKCPHCGTAVPAAEV